MHILLIDDDPILLRLLTLQLRNCDLRRRGFDSIIGCLSGGEALQHMVAAAPPVGLVFCDLQMPQMDGVETVRHLVETGYAGALVLMSGEDERILHAAERLARAYGLNVLGALRKPIAADQLRSSLDGLLGQLACKPLATPKRYSAADLQRAIAFGELVNYYQPKVDLRDGEVRGVETLVRWQHPQDGLVLPDQLIELAEANGLIGGLTRTVLRNALMQAHDWRGQGIDLNIAVNISMLNVTDLNFPGFVVETAVAADLPLDRLVLELTESQLAHDLRASLDTLTGLRLKHIGLSVDDFGTGYSSLAQLRDLPFSELKIDHGFVHGACRDSERAAIFHCSLRLARELDLDVVAEGVEERADWDYVRASGCDLAQGFFIAHPLPGERLPGWLNEWRLRRRELLEGMSCLPG